MNIKKGTFDLVFIILSTATLIILLEFRLFEKYIAFSLVPILIAYQLGKYSEKRYKDE